MLRIGTLIMFLVAIGVAYGTTLALDLLVDRSASDTAETQVDADAIFGSTEPAKLSANAKAVSYTHLTLPTTPYV